MIQLSNKRFWFLISFLFLLALISSCDNRRVEGQVTDVLGKGIDSVSVSIENLQTFTWTDEEGQFSFNTSESTVKIKFSKNGFTTHCEKLTLEKNESRTLQPLTIYPIPQKQGIFYMDVNGLQELSSENLIQIQSSDVGTNCTNLKVFTPCESNHILNSREIPFIDTSPLNEELAQTKELGVIHHSVKHFSFGQKTLYDGFQNHLTFSEVGEEKLRVLKVRLAPGNYSWIGFEEANFNNSIHADNVVSYPFTVEEIVRVEKAELNEKEPQLSKLGSGVYDFFKNLLDSEK